LFNNNKHCFSRYDECQFLPHNSFVALNKAFVMKKLILLLFITVLLIQCSTIRVFNTEAATDAEPARYKTFGFYEVKASGDTIPRTFDERMGILKKAIQVEMEKKGYRFVSSSPDLLVNIGIVVKQEVQTRQTNWQNDGRFTYMGQRNYSWKSEEIEVGRYREGTLTLHIIEVARHKMIWKGSMEGVIPEKSDPSGKTAGQALQKLFAEYPFTAN